MNHLLIENLEDLAEEKTDKIHCVIKFSKKLFKHKY